MEVEREAFRAALQGVGQRIMFRAAHKFSQSAHKASFSRFGPTRRTREILGFWSLFLKNFRPNFGSRATGGRHPGRTVCLALTCQKLDRQFLIAARQIGRILLKKSARERVLGCPQPWVSPFGSGNLPSRRLVASIWSFSSCRGLQFCALRPQLREFSEVLGDGGEEEFVLGTIGAAQA